MEGHRPMKQLRHNDNGHISTTGPQKTAEVGYTIRCGLVYLVAVIAVAITVWP